MFRVAGFAEMAYDIIAVEVDRHSREEDDGSDYEEGTPEPAYLIASGGKVAEEPFPNEPGVKRIENHTHCHNKNRHFALSSHKKREDEGALEVMEEEKSRHYVEHDIGVYRSLTGKGVTECVIEEEKESGGFHKHPGYLVVDNWPPAFCGQITVTRLEEKQADEYN